MNLIQRHREKKILGYMAQELEYDLDGKTWATIEKLTNKHDSEDIGFMVYIGPRPRDKIQEPDYDFEYGIEGVIIEGTRIRFMGCEEGLIDKIAYAEFIRRVPSRWELENHLSRGARNTLARGVIYSSDIRAYQVVREDKEGFYLVFDEEHDKISGRIDALEIGSYHASTTRFSNGVVLQGNMPPIYGEKGIEPYAGVGYGSGIYSPKDGSRSRISLKKRDELKDMLNQIENKKDIQGFLVQRDLQEILRRTKNLVE